MAKTLRKSTTKRSGKTGQFVKRGAQIGEFIVMGTAVDGTVILEPKQKPKSFTVRKLHEAVREVKDEQRRKMLGTAS